MIADKEKTNIIADQDVVALWPMLVLPDGVGVVVVTAVVDAAVVGAAVDDPAMDDAVMDDAVVDDPFEEPV